MGLEIMPVWTFSPNIAFWIFLARFGRVLNTVFWHVLVAQTHLHTLPGVIFLASFGSVLPGALCITNGNKLNIILKPNTL